MIHVKLYQKYRGFARVFTVEETVRSSISTVQAKSIAILCGMCYIPTIDRKNIETPTWPVCVSKKT